jgi:TrmH family RNA methyltransferase
MQPRFRVVLVRPEHDMNVGAVCRVMKNFGFYELVIVAPKCKLGLEARMYAKHSEEVLQKAKKTKTFSEAVKGCGVVVGTTGVAERYGGKIFKKCLPIEEIFPKIKKLEKAAITFGPESSGLSADECDKCDLMATIPTAPVHRVLNLSHAVAVVLYQLFCDMEKAEGRTEKVLFKQASQRKLAKLEELFSLAVECSPTVRNRKKVTSAFRRITRRAIPSEDEASTLLCALDSFAKAERARQGAKG